MSKTQIQLIAALIALVLGVFLIQRTMTSKTDDGSQSAQGRGSSQPMAKEESIDKKKSLYTCPMHPAVISDKPGSCPICHMDLIPVSESDHTEDLVESDSEVTSVRGDFQLTLDRQQLIGVTYGEVKKKILHKEIKATARVAFDPDLYTAIEEYRQALKANLELRKSSIKEIQQQASELVKSSQTRLRLLGLSDEKIKKLGALSESPMNLLLPKGKAWIYAEVFENEVGGVKIGDSLEATATSLPGKVFSGKVSSISPVLSGATRTVRIQAEVPDEKGMLRSDLYLNVKIFIDLGEKLSVPEDAVLYSSGQSFVFVSKEKGKFEAREVSLGEKAGHDYEVISGLKEGESIVTSANFLIDSESRLRGVLKRATKDSENLPEPGHGGH